MPLQTSSKALVDRALAKVTTLSTEQALRLVGDDDVVLVDIREPAEREHEGFIPGSVHVPRGVLEFYVDPESPVAEAVFQQPDKRFVFYCAVGWRSALAAEAVQQMGLANVAHVGGGFTEWKKAGGPVEREGT